MLRNETTKADLATPRWYSSVWQKGLGLMFRLRPPQYAVVFPFAPATRVGIHMWFVFFPLDILWLDAGGVVQEARTLRPWSYFRPTVASAWVVELPAGSIVRSGTKKGDKINIMEYARK